MMVSNKFGRLSSCRPDDKCELGGCAGDVIGYSPLARRNQKRPVPSTTSQVAPSSRLFIMDGTLPQKTPEVLPLAATFTPGTIALGSFIVALLLVGEHLPSAGWNLDLPKPSSLLHQ